VIKIAFATTDGVEVNEHFGRAGAFAIYDLTKDGFAFREMRKFAEGRDTKVEATKGAGALHDDLVEKKVKRLSDCKIVYLTEIGGPSASRLIRRGIMPIKVKDVVTIKESLEKLLEMIRTSPPPWLRKELKIKDEE
jgi:nitrogen fixation protein NifX